MSAEWPLLKSGKKGVAVRALQRLLLHRGAEVAADGEFGPATEAAVKAFQRTDKLTADGVVGGATWKAVVVLVKSGARGEPVKAIQELLAIPADGTFGPATERATRAFQERVGLSADGIVGPHTWQLLIVENPAA